MLPSSDTISSNLSIRISALLISHDDGFYLAETIAALQALPGRVPTFVFVNQLPFFGEPGNWQHTAEVAEAAGATVVVGQWRGEIEHRQAAGEHLLALGYTHALLPDGDEIIEPKLLDTLLKIAQHDIADVVHIRWDTYWKTPQFVIRPREPFTPCYLANLAVAKPVAGHQYQGGRTLHLDESFGIVHHLSWVGPEQRIQRKLDSWAHAKEVLPGWRERVWRGWDSDQALTNLHPTHPGAYGFAEHIALPEVLLPAYQKWKQLTGFEEPEPLAPVSPWPRLSVVIPVYGNPEDLETCLASLSPLHEEGLLHEVLVVDDASPEAEAIATTVQSFSFATLQRQEANGGFAATCNAGATAATGGEATKLPGEATKFQPDLLLFLNSDTAVPREGLLRLVESLASASPLVAAAGPYTNHSGHLQQVQATYTTLATMPLFAEDFARRDPLDAPDRDVDMLVGFCLLVRASVFHSIGGFDTRFGRGLFEDNDLCYRLRREGFRLTLAARAFVHHTGSKSLKAALADPQALLAHNQQLYLAKWKQDLTSGYASHLAGLPQQGAPERILFDPARKPEERLRQARQRARQADISLIMIVKNEQRVLAECLSSAMPFFAETIVVDTGSTDNTVQIAQAAGARVFHFPWTNSFSEARNQSLAHAKGRWLFWLDADDTLSLEAGEAIQQAALAAPPHACAFVVPVQFVEEGGMPGGTRVDHVKLFRSHPDLQFEGRIHEQILPSLRQAFGQDALVLRAPAAAVVLHSGYDTSPEGQARKRERDETLLQLDLAERPGHPFVLFNLGMTEHYGGRHELAIDWLRQCIAASQSGESHVRKAYALLAVSHRELGRIEEALDALTEGLASVGSDPELHFQAGFTHALEQQWAEAREHYEQAVGGDASGHFSSMDTGIVGYKAFHNLGQVCLECGDYPAACQWWERAISDAPSFTPSLFALFDAALACSDWGRVQWSLERVWQLEGPSESWAGMLAKRAELLGGATSAEQSLYQVLEAHPGALGVKLVLARRLLAASRENEAAPLLRDLAAAGVSEGAYCMGVMASRGGDFASALDWMERALELNPEHAQTAEQVVNLRKAIQSKDKAIQGKDDEIAPVGEDHPTQD